MSINIIGYGFVGTSIGFLCEQNNINFNVCDPEEKTSTSTKFKYFKDISKLVKNSEVNDLNFYIIAVPTPSDLQGNCDISIIKNVLNSIKQNVTKETYVIIKSTLVPGTCDKLNNEFPNLNIVFFPEFLRESTYKTDSYNAKFILLGIPSDFELTKYFNVLRVVKKLYTHNPSIDVIIKNYKECEIFKYTLNNYFITKITFFNEIYELCDAMNVDYQSLKGMFNLDSRIGDYGIHVPGEDGKFGAGKKCLPKELAGMIKLRESLELDITILQEIQKKNDILRLK